MQVELVAMRSMINPSRPEAGVVTSVHRVTTDDGATGLAEFHLEWDKRDVTAESLHCEPQVAQALRDAMPDMNEDGDSPSCYNFFSNSLAEMGPIEAIQEAEEKCETQLYNFT